MSARKSEHCSDGTLLNQNLFGLGEGTQVNWNIVRIALPPNRNLFSLHEGTQLVYYIFFHINSSLILHAPPISPSYDVYNCL